MRRACVMLLLLTLPGCFDDRPRPSPVGPGAQPRLTVEVLSPANNSTQRAGDPVAVDVRAADLDGSGLTGIGFIARRTQGALLIDSVAVLFPAGRTSARDTFEFVLPAQYPTNTQVDIYGLAFGRQGAVQTSVPRSVVVVGLAP